MWEFEHSVETQASRPFVWRFWTNVANWALDSSLEWVHLDGPFAAGTRGTTKSPGLDPMHWLLREVRPETGAIIEMALTEAVLSFHWRFEDVAGGGTRITQCLTLTGPNADSYVEQIAPEFEQGVPQGMRKLAHEVALAERREQSAAPDEGSPDQFD